MYRHRFERALHKRVELYSAAEIEALFRRLFEADIAWGMPCTKIHVKSFPLNYGKQTYLVPGGRFLVGFRSWFSDGIYYMDLEAPELVWNVLIPADRGDGASVPSGPVPGLWVAQLMDFDTNVDKDNDHTVARMACAMMEWPQDRDPDDNECGMAYFSAWRLELSFNTNGVVDGINAHFLGAMKSDNMVLMRGFRYSYGNLIYAEFKPGEGYYHQIYPIGRRRQVPGTVLGPIRENTEVRRFSWKSRNATTILLMYNQPLSILPTGLYISQSDETLYLWPLPHESEPQPEPDIINTSPPSGRVSQALSPVTIPFPAIDSDVIGIRVIRENKINAYMLIFSQEGVYKLNIPREGLPHLIPIFPFNAHAFHVISTKKWILEDPGTQNLGFFNFVSQGGRSMAFAGIKTYSELNIDDPNTKFTHGSVDEVTWRVFLGAEESDQGFIIDFGL